MRFIGVNSYFKKQNIPLEIRKKMAWVVTDCMNEACGMERKKTTEAVRC